MKRSSVQLRALMRLIGLATPLIALAGCATPATHSVANGPVVTLSTICEDDGIVMVDEDGPTDRLHWLRQVTLFRRHDQRLFNDKGWFVPEIPIRQDACGIVVTPDAEVTVNIPGSDRQVGQIIVVSRANFDRLLKDAVDRRVVYEVPRRNVYDTPILRVQYYPWPKLDD